MHGKLHGLWDLKGIVSMCMWRAKKNVQSQGHNKHMQEMKDLDICAGYTQTETGSCCSKGQWSRLNSQQSNCLHQCCSQLPTIHHSAQFRSHENITACQQIWLSCFVVFLISMIPYFSCNPGPYYFAINQDILGPSLPGICV